MIVEPMLEREAELHLVQEMLDDAAAGHGRTCVVEGPAGIGKTRLLAAVRAAAGERGFDVLAARGGSMERELPFGIVRQLFEVRVRRLGPDERDSLLGGAAALASPVLGLRDGVARPLELGEDRSFSVLHGLYWLTSNLSEGAPLLVVVDDAQWADLPSLRYVEYLTRRAADLPVVVLVATRPRESIEQAVLVERIVVDPESSRISLRPLGEASAAELVRRSLGTEASDALCTACHTASGGNPFLLGELALALRAEGLASSEAEAERVSRIAPRTISRAVFARLAHLPAPADELTRAVAVLGSGAEPAEAAALTGLSDEEVADTVDALVRADVLAAGRPLEFIHPVVREAVYADLGPQARERAHTRAAEVLHDAGAEPGRVAAQLLASRPDGRSWAVATLRDAAETAFAQGAPDAAVTYLRRALLEPPTDEEHTGVVRRLGRAQVLTGDPDGVPLLEQALTATPAGPLRAEVARELAHALVSTMRFDEAILVLDRAISELGVEDGELAMLLHVDAASAGKHAASTYATTQRLDALVGEVSGGTPTERMLLASRSFRYLLEGRSARESLAAARTALEGGLLVEQGLIPSFFDALYASIAADDRDLARRWCDEGLVVSRATGNIWALALTLAFSSDLNYRRGSLVEAESDARASLGASRSGAPSITWIAQAFLLDVLIDRGRTTEGEELLGPLLTAPVPDTLNTNVLLFSRARLRAALGDTAGGLADLVEVAAREERSPNTRMWAHRSATALVLAARGEQPQAERLADEALARAEAWGTPRAIGTATRARGLVVGGEPGIDLLRTACEVLEDSGARLEHARALVDLGGSLRRAGQRVDARGSLKRGLELAHVCGATALEDRALDELRVSGARTKRPVSSGVAALTPSEQRVSAMAADGMPNREIAQTLFLSLKTIEMHLARAFRKLEVHSRTELSVALARGTR